MSPTPNAGSSTGVRRDLDVLSVAECARLIRVGPKVIRRLVKLGHIPHKVVDERGTLRFSRTLVIDWFEGYVDGRGRRVAR